MSEYTHCRECGEDLLANGRGFGALECCCDQGYCTGCCPDTGKVIAEIRQRRKRRKGATA